MIKLLPKLLKFFVVIAFFLFFINFAAPTFAQPAPTATPTPDITTGWVKDQEVTFVGKTATRANYFLQWTLSVENYRWITLPTNNDNPIQDFWVIVRNIVFVLLALFVLGAAFVMIITRGQNLTIMRFVPRFIIIVVLVLLSFALIRFVYQATDVVQGFFLNIQDPVTNQNRNIGPQDLLYIAFDYENFLGYRKLGIEFDESAFISLLLVKLTAITYYVMTGLLLIRKIILWFFIIVSPIFPLLLFFRPVRNTAKIWIGEFFRWLLYAPLFALFLHGLVNVWRSGIPMAFNFADAVAGTTKYPTAINILLGGPGQQIGLSNSVNLPDTFALYVVALLMLWVVILLPFLLLQIFLDYLSNMSISESPVIKKITSNSWFNKAYGGPPPVPGQPSPSPAPFGLAKSLPFFNKRSMELPIGKSASSTVKSTNIISRNVENLFNRSADTFERASASNLQSVRETRDILRQANLSVPKMRDIARYETSMLKKDSVSKSEVSKFHETLEKISTPTIAATPIDREKFTSIKEKLIQSQKQGDPLATSVINATQITSKSTQIVNKETINNSMTEVLKSIASPESVTTPAQKERITEIKEKLVKEKEKGDPMATSVLSAAEKVNDENIPIEERKTLVEKTIEKLHESAKQGNQVAASIVTEGSKSEEVSLPTVNKVQQVSIEEYEDVKKMWQENYQNMETPIGPTGIPLDKHSFIEQDIGNITETINLLSSDSQQNVDKGMERVANILPFLLLGGFSKTEVISYLKAKLEAGKSVLTGVDAKKEDEDTLLERKDETGHAKATMEMHQELPTEEEKSPLTNLQNDPTAYASENENKPDGDEGNGTPGGTPPGVSS